MRKLLLLATATLLALQIKAQYSIPAPTDLDALTKLKASDALLGELKANGLTLGDVTFKLKKKEVKFLESDEVCYRIYRDSKKIEGSNYIFDYEITAKQNKVGDIYKSVGYVWYTRADITKTTCNIENKWIYEFSQVDKFSIVTKNGFLTAAEAERLILDTLSKGFDLDYVRHRNENKNEPLKRWTEICRIDNFRTCEYDKFEYAEYSQVINKMEDNKHRISFEVVIYRGQYETGNVYASMYRILKSYSLINCYFNKVKGKAAIASIELVDDKNTSDLVEPDRYAKKPLEIYYTPLSKTQINNIRGKFSEGKPMANSILYYLKPLEEMVSELNSCTSKDYDSYYKICQKYCTAQKANEISKHITEKLSLKFKITPWEIAHNPSDFSCIIKCRFSHKKSSPEVYQIIVDSQNMELANEKYLLK